MQSALRSPLGRRFRLAVAVAALLISPSLVRARQIRDARDPYVAASQSTGVPLELLAAIAGAESAYHPWALNLRGRQVYCRSRAEAERLISGFDDVDIGLMQVNFPHGADALASPRANCSTRQPISWPGLAFCVNA